MLHPDFLRLPVAHRALHDIAAGRPENSLAAIRAAIAAGYAIEIDVQLSADGQAVVFHDDDLPRLTGAEGAVRDKSAAELTALTLLGTAERVPRLTEVLAEIAGRVPLVIEIKDQSLCLGPLDGRLEAEVAKALALYAGPVAVMSFNPASMAHMAVAAPGVARGLTSCSFREDWWEDVPPARRAELAALADYADLGAVFVSHRHDDLDNPRLADLKAGGAAILCWTISSEAEEAAARRVADNVTFEGYAARLP